MENYKGEKLVYDFIKALEDDADLAKDAGYIKEKIPLVERAFEIVKPNIAEADYAEAVQIGIVTIWRNRTASINKIVGVIKKELCIKNANKNVALSDLIDPYANSYTDDEMDEGLTVTKTGVPAYVRDEDSVIFDITIGKLADESQNLNNPVDVRNAIFLDVVIKGMPVVAVAKKYRMTTQEISTIVEERKAFVVNELTVDYGAVAKDVETREPYKSLVKQMTDPKNTNK